MSKITFGRYSPKNTFIHRMDPRNKILILILLMVAIFLQFTHWSTTLVLSGVLLLVIIIFMIISRINFIELFRSMATMWFLIIILMAAYIFIPMSTYIGTPVAFYIGTFAVYWAGIYQSGYIILRLIMMLSLTIQTYNTRITKC